MKKILIDTDPGMDDTLAIILAIKSSAVQLLGISSVAGNYPIEVTTRNALKTIELVKRTDIPVARGMGKPLARPLAKDPFSHGSDGQAETHLPEPRTKPSGKHGVDQIIDMVRANPGEVTVITLGPLTNLAMAFMKEPDIVPLVKEVVAIAGSFGFNKYAFANATGDTPQSEWNVFGDPEAARLVFESGVPVRAVGLITEPKQADDIVAAGRADMVAMARAILADPRWPWRAAAALGHDFKTAPQLARAAGVHRHWVAA